MPKFGQCFVCRLELPISVLEPIQIKNQGRIMIVPLCDTCRKIKEQEAKEKSNGQT